MAATVEIDADARRHDVWVTRFGFADHLSGRTDFDTLCALVALPDPDEDLYRLVLAAHSLDVHARGLLERTSTLVRRRLATEEPAK